MTKGGRKWWSNRADRPTTGPHMFRNLPLTRDFEGGSRQTRTADPLLVRNRLHRNQCRCWASDVSFVEGVVDVPIWSQAEGVLILGEI